MIKNMKGLKYGGNMYVILIYDIKQTDDFAKVQRKTYKTCKRYLYHVQNSVFEGELLESQIEKLKYELNMHLRIDLDSCIMFKSRNKKWLEKEFLTQKIDLNEQFI